VSSARGERFAVAALPARPWKNGGGTTRELAVSPDAAGLDHFDWRLSIADVLQDGSFSHFAGVDRQIVLLQGAGMRLRGPAGLDHRLNRIGEGFSFGGDLPIDAALLEGPTRDLNVMTRRGVWRAQVSTLRAAAAVDAADACLLLCGQGSWQLEGDRMPLREGEARLWRVSSGPHRLVPVGGAAWLIAVRLCHDPAP
jgi:uncharacterized protein